jgi:hypothetical protein
MAYPHVPPGADFGTAAARARIAACVSPRYRGQLHLVGLLAQAGLIMGVAASFLREVRAWEWLLVPAALVFANGVEWVIHRGPLHHPAPPRILYNRHTLTHHAAFSHEDMSVRSWRELRVVLFPLFALPGLQVLILPVVGLLWWALGRNAAALFVLAATFYYLLYELLHLSYHLPVEHPVSRLGVVRRLKRHHRRHHDPRRMTDGNFNVSIPLFDWILGTRLRDDGEGLPAQRTTGEPAQSSEAEASGLTHTTS